VLVGRRRDMNDLEELKEIYAELEGMKMDIIDSFRPLPRWVKRIIWFFYPMFREQG